MIQNAVNIERSILLSVNWFSILTLMILRLFVTVLANIQKSNPCVIDVGASWSVQFVLLHYLISFSASRNICSCFQVVVVCIAGLQIYMHVQ